MHFRARGGPGPDSEVEARAGSSFGFSSLANFYLVEILGCFNFHGCNLQKFRGLRVISFIEKSVLCSEILVKEV